METLETESINYSQGFIAGTYVKRAPQQILHFSIPFPDVENQRKRACADFGKSRVWLIFEVFEGSEIVEIDEFWSISRVFDLFFAVFVFTDQ
jgi:hypothetical protein